MPQENNPWCRGCCTIHEKDGICPGELLASGPERHGWRGLVDLPQGPEVYGTLVAPAGSRWRARILTFPNVLWGVRGGGTMKFVSDSPQGAQAKAVEHIRKHCKRRGLTLRSEITNVESGEVDPEQDAKTSTSTAVQASQRQLRSLLIRFGLGRPSEEGETDDLSESGLFIRTDSPICEGTVLALRLEINGFGVPMKGVVRWVREASEDGRPGGMGIKLDQPHPRYVHYIRQQRDAPEPKKYELEVWKKGQV